MHDEELRGADAETLRDFSVGEPQSTNELADGIEKETDFGE